MSFMDNILNFYWFQPQFQEYNLKHMIKELFYIDLFLDSIFHNLLRLNQYYMTIFNECYT
jgi:hypothetical protein